MELSRKKLKVGISIGDFNGVGPEIILKFLKEKSVLDFMIPVIFGSGKVLNYQKNIFKINVNLHYVEEAAQASEGKINVINVHKDNLNVQFGQVTTEASSLALQSFQTAVEALKNEDIDVLVTAPINKIGMMEAGFPFPGHTEYLEQELGGKSLMMLTSDMLRTAVLSHHIPLSEVKQQVKKEYIVKSIEVLNKTLIQDFQIERPKIAVLGLNPHAGDGGKIGQEEIEEISPAIEELREKGILAFGSFPADSFFQTKNLNLYDAVLAMYHDQGLIPFKTLAYGSGVNYTAGISKIRTSPDHGVAYDIAGKGIAEASSFAEAVYLAIDIYHNRNEYLYLQEHKLIPKPENQSHKKPERGM